MSDLMTSPDYNPWNYTYVIVGLNGNSELFNMAYLDMFRLYGSRLAISYATQFGASLMMLLVLLLVTRAEKRRSFIFVVNALTLAANATRSMLCALYTTSKFWSLYFQLTHDCSHIYISDKATDAAATVMGVVVTALVYASLSMQVWTVCALTSNLQRTLIIGTTTSLACVALGVKIAASVAIIQQQCHEMKPDDKLNIATPVLQLLAIWLYSSIFTFKLGFAVMRRHRLNMPQFGPMQIVFIMGCQTMIIPAIFHVCQFYGQVAELATLGLTTVCIFLPLSAMWAGVNDNNSENADPRSIHHLINNEFLDVHPSSAQSSTAGTLLERSRQMSICACMSKECKDIERDGGLPPKKSNITIDREFGIMSEQDEGKL